MADKIESLVKPEPPSGMIEKMKKKYADDKEKAKERFEELIQNPPEIEPEDNPDLWR